MQAADFLKQQDISPILDIADILLKPDEKKLLHKCMVHTVLHILVDFGGEALARFVKVVEDTQPKSDEKIPAHCTLVHPLLYVNINESTTTGNAEVLESIYKHLEPRPTVHWHCKDRGD